MNSTAKFSMLYLGLFFSFSFWLKVLFFWYALPCKNSKGMCEPDANVHKTSSRCILKVARHSPFVLSRNTGSAPRPLTDGSISLNLINQRPDKKKLNVLQEPNQLKGHWLNKSVLFPLLLCCKTYLICCWQ